MFDSKYEVLCVDMSIDELQGRAYEETFLVDRSRVAAFVEATGDDPGQWDGTAPPAFAAAALFAVAPSFLYDPDVESFSNVLIHADQTFRWRAPWRVDTEYVVTGSVHGVRMRGGSAWVTFGAVVTVDDDTTLESLSTFIMSDRRPDTDVDEREEPGPHDKTPEVRPDSYPMDGPLPDTVRSASRSDLIRYAASTRDFNPLHWDHGTARNAGLPGVVVHGLLMASWLMQVSTAAAAPDAVVPIVEAKLRFGNPLFPGQPASIGGTVDGSDGAVRLEVASPMGRLATASFLVER